ncbi:MAG: toprim domain-containing protein [Candidatus Paceibacterota bacterium]
MLYGLDKAKLDIRRNDRCLVVEGNMDVIMSHQVGATNVVASSGTALTDGHLKILKRYTDNLDLCFDADAAGTMATDRGVDLALARGFNVGIVSIDEPDLKDPADYVKKYGPKWSEYAAKSRPFMEFYFETAKKTLDITTALGKKLMAQKLMPFLASMTNKIERSHWLGELSMALKLKEEVLVEEIAKVRPKGQEEEEAVPSVTKESPLDVMEEGLLALTMKKPELAQNISTEFEQFLSGKVKELLANMKSKEGDKIVAQLTSTVDPSLAMSLEFVYLKSQEFWKDIDDKELELEFNKILNQIKRKKISARLADLEYDIKSAEKSRDKQRLVALTAEFSKISRELPQ